VLLGAGPEDLGIMLISEAYSLAMELHLGVVEEDRNGDPPVVRICDYGKMIYEHEVGRREVVREARRIIREVIDDDPPLSAS
jgi:translation initiation factor IF-3